MEMKEKKREIIKILIAVILLCFFNFFWFLQISDKIFLAGDDLRTLSDIKYSNHFLRDALTNATGVYRPVSLLIISIIVKIIGVKTKAYYIFNICFNCLNIASLFYVSYKIVNKKNIYIPTFASIMYIISIYAYYGLTQINGLMELLCVFGIIWFTYFLFYYVKENSKKNLYLSLAFDAFVVLSHERFLTLVGVYFIVIFFLTDEKIINKLKTFLVCSIPTLYFCFAKLIIFKAKLFVGTGQVEIKLDFLQILKYIGRSIASIFGFNKGENWIFSTNFNELSNAVKCAIVLILIIYVYIFIAYIIKNIILSPQRRQEIQYLLMFVFVEGACICCYVVSSRIEMRQIYVPYVVFLIYISYCISKINLCGVFLQFITWCSLINSFIFQQSIDNLFFMRAMKLSKSVYNTVIESGELLTENEKIYIEYNNELDWAIMASDANEKRSIFYLFLNKNIDTETFVSLEDVKSDIDMDLKNGRNVKLMFINNNIETSYITIENKSQLDTLDLQLLR